jgi:LysW-gamma-L-lysine/LysW-L-ornithine aminotransferase
MDILTTETTYEVGVYPKRPLAIVRGEGARLWDAEGREFIDCVGGQGAANLGHANPAVAAAIREQAERLISCPEILPNDVRALYLAELAAALPVPGRIFLCNSGAEAVEGAIKFARLLTGRAEVVACQRGFHGRTMGALSATWEPKYREPFEPLVPGYSHVPYDNLERLEAAVSERTAALLLEVVQGEGGVRPASAAFLRGAQELCRRHGALLLVDEVQTGFARTGRLWGVEHTGLEPDIMMLAKSMAGGVPMGAVVLHERLGTLPMGSHGSTFGGNPLACAAGRAALRYIQEHGLADEAQRKGDWLLGQLRELDSPLIREVRGLGLLVGVELKQRVQPYLQRLLERGVLALPAGPNVLRLLPPLVIAEEELARVVEAIGAALKD